MWARDQSFVISSVLSDKLRSGTAVSRLTLVVGVSGDEREAESRAPAAGKRAAVVRGLYLSGGDPHLRRGFRGALAERDVIDAQRGRQHDHVDAFERR